MSTIALGIIALISIGAGVGIYHYLGPSYFLMIPAATAFLSLVLKVPALKMTFCTSTLDNKTSLEKFVIKKWKTTDCNRTILKLTTLSSKTPQPTQLNDITYSQTTEMNEKQLNELLKKKIDKNWKKKRVDITTKWYNYEKANEGYVNFANGTERGGGYKTNGRVQEEIMFFEFPCLPNLDYLADKANVYLQASRKTNSGPTPYCVLGIKREFVIDSAIYSRNSNVRTSEFSRYIQEIDEDNRPTVDMLAMAAFDWKKMRGEKKYTKEIHLFHLETAVQAFTAYRDLKRQEQEDPSLEVTIHSGLWGCGAFGNSRKVMTVIQLLAANLVPGITIVMEGCQKKDENDSDYTENFVKNEAFNFILDDGHACAEDVISSMLNKQEEDPSWAPRQHSGC
ncbi:MAG: hypothetical protein KDK55_07110 [Chlamydiia bacterium]|nr:hypothetical protein [Chlamydiia bacterium]